LFNPGGVEEFDSREGGLEGGSFTLGDRTYRMLRGSATFVSPSVMVPSPGAPEEGFSIASSPFRYQGFFDGESSDGERVRIDLIGRGTADVFFDYSDGSARWFSSIYQFSDPTPVPEPTSVLLLSIGVGAGLLRRQRIKPSAPSEAVRVPTPLPTEAMTVPPQGCNQKLDCGRLALIVALLVAIPAVTHGDPITTLTSGSFVIDHTDLGSPTDLAASGLRVEASLFGGWVYASQPFVTGRFIDPSFSGVVHVRVAELRSGNRILRRRDFVSPPWIFNVSISGPHAPKQTRDDFEGAFVDFPASFRGLLSGVTNEGEFTIDLTGEGRGFLFFRSPPADGLAFAIDSIFTFQETAPIPEPGTILLLSAAGTIGLFRRRSRARNAIRDDIP
jgi:hypothetical protein